MRYWRVVRPLAVYRTGLLSVALVSILPMLLIFVFFQRYFVQGIAGSGMK